MNTDCNLANINFGVGYAFVPTHMLEKVYSPAEALNNGTLFPELNLPKGVYEKGVKNCG